MGKGFNNGLSNTSKTRVYAQSKINHDFTIYIDRPTPSLNSFGYNVRVNGAIYKISNRLELLELLQEIMDKHYGEEIP